MYLLYRLLSAVLTILAGTNVILCLLDFCLINYYCGNTLCRVSFLTMNNILNSAMLVLGLGGLGLGLSLHGLVIGIGGQSLAFGSNRGLIRS